MSGGGGGGTGFIEPEDEDEDEEIRWNSTILGEDSREKKRGLDAEGCALRCDAQSPERELAGGGPCAGPGGCMMPRHSRVRAADGAVGNCCQDHDGPGPCRGPHEERGRGGGGGRLEEEGHQML